MSALSRMQLRVAVLFVALTLISSRPMLLHARPLLMPRPVLAKLRLALWLLQRFPTARETPVHAGRLMSMMALMFVKLNPLHSLRFSSLKK